MKYIDFIQKLNEMEKQAFALPFSCAGKIYEDRFSACFELAQTLLQINNTNIESVAKMLSKIPSKYVNAVFIIAKKLDSSKSLFIAKIREELEKIYLLEFKNATKKSNKFMQYSNKAVQSYLSGELRIVDEVEIMKLARILGLNADDIIGEYTGEDTVTKILSGARQKLRKNPTYSKQNDLIEQTLISNINKSIKNIKQAENKISV